MSVRRSFLFASLALCLASLAFSLGSWSAQRSMAQQIADGDARVTALRDDVARSIWLDGGAHLDDVAALLGPAPDEYLAPRRVSRLVSNARNEGPECLAEAGVEGLGLV